MVDDMTVMIQSRDQEIVQIAKSIEELGSIFKELAVLVIDQGTILDRIDYNMEAVVESTKTGIKQLEKAEQHQKNARPLRCIVCLSVTIFVLLVILILKHRPRHGWF
jgi:syntaxin 16